MGLQKTNRYPGALPFAESQNHLFFGRKKATTELYKLIRINPLVVLYSKSGLGKSSLLNAGIIPKVYSEGKYDPILIRFGSWAKDVEFTPLSITHEKITQNYSKETFLNKIYPDDHSLWYAAKTRQINANTEQPILLIFDQFEELFTYPEDQIKKFAKHFSELLYTEIPQRISNFHRLKELAEPGFLSEKKEKLLYKDIPVKIILAIRSDRMSLLDRLTLHIPLILQNRFELNPLNAKEAKEAIIAPTLLEGDFLSPAFEYQEDALDEMLNYLTKDYSTPVESFQLQVLCESMERRIKEKNISIISKTELGDPKEVFENYYDNQIKSLGNESEQLAARQLIEEGLIFEEEERRLSIYEGQIYRQYDISEDLLEKLVNTHLIRREPSMKGGYTYELSHDTLVSPVLKAKEKRKEKQARVTAENEALVWKQEARKEKLKRQRARLFAFLGFLLATIAFSAMIYAKKIANENEELAIYNEKLAHTAERDAKLAEYNEKLAQSAEKDAKYLAVKNELLAEEMEKERNNALVLASQNKDLAAQNYVTVAKYALRENPTKAIRLSQAALEFDINNTNAKETFQKIFNDSRHPFYQSEIKGHFGALTAIAFDQNDTIIYTGSIDKTVKKWSIDGKFKGTILELDSPVTSIAVSKTKSQKILIGSADGTVTLLGFSNDLNKKEVKHEGGKAISSICFAPHENFFVTASLDSTIQIWNMEGELETVLRGHKGGVTAVDISHDEKYILSGGIDNWARIWSVKEEREIDSLGFQKLSKDISSVAFSPNGEYILTGCHDKIIRLYQFNEEELKVYLKKELRNHEHEVTSVVFDPSSKYILTTSNDKTAKLWNINGSEMKTFKAHTDYILDGVFSKDGSYILTGSKDFTAKIWYNHLKEISNQKRMGGISSIAISSSGKKIIVGSFNGSANIFEINNQDTLINLDEIITLRGHRKDVTTVALSSDNKYILTGSKDGSCIVWDSNGKQINTIENAKYSEILSVATSSDGKYFLIGSRNGIATLLTTSKFQTKIVLKGHKGEINSVAFSPINYGKQFITAGQDGKAIIWDRSNGRKIKELQGKSSGILSVSFSNNGELIATGHTDGTINLWEKSSGNIIHTFSGHKDDVFSVAFSKTGDYILSGSRDQTAILWNTPKRGKTNPFYYKIEGFKDWVNAVSFLSLEGDNNEYLFAGSWDGYLRWWTIDQILEANKIVELSPLDKVDNGLKVQMYEFIEYKRSTLEHEGDQFELLEFAKKFETHFEKERNDSFYITLKQVYTLAFSDNFLDDNKLNELIEFVFKYGSISQNYKDKKLNNIYNENKRILSKRIFDEDYINREIRSKKQKDLLGYLEDFNRINIYNITNEDTIVNIYKIILNQFVKEGFLIKNSFDDLLNYVKILSDYSRMNKNEMINEIYYVYNRILLNKISEEAFLLKEIKSKTSKELLDYLDDLNKINISYNTNEDATLNIYKIILNQFVKEEVLEDYSIEQLKEYIKILNSYSTIGYKNDKIPDIYSINKTILINKLCNNYSTKSEYSITDLGILLKDIFFFQDLFDNTNNKDTRNKIKIALEQLYAGLNQLIDYSTTKYVETNEPTELLDLSSSLRDNILYNQKNKEIINCNNKIWAAITKYDQLNKLDFKKLDNLITKIDFFIKSPNEEIRDSSKRYLQKIMDRIDSLEIKNILSDWEKLGDFFSYSSSRFYQKDYKGRAYYRELAIKYYKMILAQKSNDDSIKYNLVINYASLAFQQIHQGEFVDAITNSEQGDKIADEIEKEKLKGKVKDILLTNWVMGYLYSGQFEKAKKLYLENKCKDYRFRDNYDFRKIFLQDLDVTSHATPPEREKDVEKIIELLRPKCSKNKALSHN